MTILITGGAGFIGSHLTEALLRAGHSVVCLDDFNDYYSPALKERNLRAAMENPRFALVRGDIRRAEDLDRAFALDTVGAVVHLAARAGVRPSLQAPGLYSEVNIGGTIQVLEACRRHGVPRLVMASSSSVYGGRTRVPFREEDAADQPISPYAATKRAAELMAYTYHHLYGTSVSCLRFFTVYGPRQRPDMAIHQFARAILEGREIVVYGDGSTRRDYTYVDDIVAGVLGAVEAEYGYEIFNLGNSRTVRLDALIGTLERALGRPALRRHEPEQAGDVPITYADIRRAARILGYCPRVSIEEGVRRFADWFVLHREAWDAASASTGRPGAEDTGSWARPALPPAHSSPLPVP